MTINIIIPHYGSDEHLKNLFPSLGLEFDKLGASLVTHYKGKGTEVWVVNNNLAKNMGFTKACNIGIKVARQKHTGLDTCFWLLNNDTYVENLAESIKAIEEEFEKNPVTGIIGNKIVTFDDPDFIHHGGTGSPFPAGVHKVGRVSLDNLNKRTREGWVTGASMIIHEKVLAIVGLLDENMVSYGSDSDFCFRVRAAGFDVAYVPFTIRHKVGQSANPDEKQMRQIKADMLTFADKWVNGKLFHNLNSEFFNNE